MDVPRAVASAQLRDGQRLAVGEQRHAVADLLGAADDASLTGRPPSSGGSCWS